MMNAFGFLVGSMFLLIVGSGDGLNTPATIKLLVDAHAANEARYPSGKMRYELREEQNQSGSRSFQLIDATVEWRDGMVRTSLTRYGPSSNPIDKSSSSIRKRQEEYIVNKTQFIAHFPPNQAYLATIIDHNLSTEQHIFPKDYWYGSGLGDSPYIKVFELIDKKTREQNHPSVVAKAISKGEVSLSDSDPHSGEKTRASFSLNDDGNITFVESSNGNGYSKSEKNFWSRTGDNLIYLGSREESETISRDGSTSKAKFLYTTIDFKPDYMPSTSAFTLDGLNLKPGVLINDDVNKTIYRLGEASPPSVFQSLNDLAESMRLRGFAAPKK